MQPLADNMAFTCFLVWSFISVGLSPVQGREACDVGGTCSPDTMSAGASLMQTASRKDHISMGEEDETLIAHQDTKQSGSRNLCASKSCVGENFAQVRGKWWSGRSVCEAELCPDSAPYVSKSTFGCSATDAHVPECCSTLLCSSSPPAPTSAPAPTPAPPSAKLPCNDWCDSDHNSGKNQGRHCEPGDMAHLCGGCSFCRTPTPRPTPEPPAPTPKPTAAPTSPGPTPAPPSAKLPCNGWCDSDYNSGKNQGRHCEPGDMAHLCGGCSFCQRSQTPTPEPSAPTPKPTAAPTSPGGSGSLCAPSSCSHGRPDCSGSEDAAFCACVCHDSWEGACCSRRTQTCGDVWDKMAGDHTCGDRISWLKNNDGLSDADAHRKVASQFPMICGACMPPTSAPTPAPLPTPAPPTQAPTPVPPSPTCDEVTAGEQTCGDRIAELKQSLSDAEAREQVATQFSVCAPCMPDPCDGPALTTCTVEQGQCLLLADEKNCDKVVVRGTLRLMNGARLRTPMLMIEQTGRLLVGSHNYPARDVEIDLKWQGQLLSEGRVYIYGEQKTSWTTVAQTCDHCKTLVVNECNGWKVDDNIVLVGTGNGEHRFMAPYTTETRRIQSINGCTITVDKNADNIYQNELYQDRIQIVSEVLNMDRSVKFVGQEIRTRQQFSGIMKIHYTKISNCGLRNQLGEYCMHFHHVGVCPGCSFVGNAVGWPGINKALTIHGTNNALVEGNAVYDHKGAYIYLEDGSETGNIIKDNALVCPTMAGCNLCDGVPEQIRGDCHEQSGVYAISPYNDFVGNHIAGHENALFHDQSAGGAKTWGGGIVKNKVCPQAYPFGIVKGNYFHNNNGFGFYAPQSGFPKRVQTDPIGYVTDWRSCLAFDLRTGEDNAAPVLVEDHTELFHNFGGGGYDGGDVSFKNAIFAFANTGNYFKTFRTGASTPPMCDGCYYHKIDVGPNLPGGSCFFEMKDTVFDDVKQLELNHHCGYDERISSAEWTGGLCASHFWLTGGTQWTRKDWQQGDRNEIVLTSGLVHPTPYSDSLVHFQGKTYFGTAEAHPTFSTDNCQAGQAGNGHGDYTACPSADLRIVKIYSPRRGDLIVTNHAEGDRRTTVPYTPWQKPEHWSPPNKYDKVTQYMTGGMGYTFLVKEGQSYTIQVGSATYLTDLFTLEYSEAKLSSLPITVTVTGDSLLSGPQCTIGSDHARGWITPYGPMHPQTGAWWNCVKWKTMYTKEDYEADQRAHFGRRGIHMD